MHHNQQKEYYKYREFCKTNKQMENWSYSALLWLQLKKTVKTR